MSIPPTRAASGGRAAITPHSHLRGRRPPPAGLRRRPVVAAGPGATEEEAAAIAARIAGLMAGPRQGMAARLGGMLVDIQQRLPPPALTERAMAGVYDIVYGTTPWMRGEDFVLSSIGPGLPATTATAGAMRCLFADDSYSAWCDLTLVDAAGAPPSGLLGRMSIDAFISIEDSATLCLGPVTLRLWCVDPRPGAEAAWRREIGSGSLAYERHHPDPRPSAHADYFDGTWLIGGFDDVTMVLLRRSGA